MSNAYAVDSNGNILEAINGASPPPANSIVITKGWEGKTLYIPRFDFTLNDWVEAKPPSEILQIAKDNKKAELQSASDKAVETFKSSALGTVHTYLADEKSMNYLNAEYSFVKSSDYDNGSIDWYTVEAGFVTHSGTQISQVFLDGRTYIKEQKTVKLKLLFEQVEGITITTDLQTALNEVEAIIW